MSDLTIESRQLEIESVLLAHQDAPTLNGGRECICGGWSGPWTGNDFAGHVARLIMSKEATRD